MNETAPRKKALYGCLGILGLAVVFTCLGGFGIYWAIDRALTDFEYHRDKMALRSELEVIDSNLLFSPGFDDVMWCRFRVEAESIDEIFDTDLVDTKEFTSLGYQLDIGGMEAEWWDPKEHTLIGGEVQTDSDKFLRVGYVKNDDGTITVYIYWFEI